MNDPSMIGFLGLPAVDITGVTVTPNEQEIRYSPYQERTYEDKGGTI